VIKAATSPAGRRVLSYAVRVARTEEGRKLIAQAGKVARSPEGRKLISQVKAVVKQPAENSEAAWHQTRFAALRRRFTRKP
jgi:hypothetical protein